MIWFNNNYVDPLNRRRRRRLAQFLLWSPTDNEGDAAALL